MYNEFDLFFKICHFEKLVWREREEMKVVMRSHSENDFKRHALVSLIFSRCYERVPISDCGKTLDNNNFVINSHRVDKVLDIFIIFPILKNLVRERENESGDEMS